MTRNIEKIETMKGIIEERIPLGFSVKDARIFLEKERFTCLNKAEYEVAYLQDGECLFCERRDGGTFIFDRWVVVITYEDDSVTKVQVDKNLYDVLR